VVVGGGMFQKFGIVEEYWKETGSKHIDKGRFDVTHNPADMYVFKVPGLRNVAMVRPYFHDGSVGTLPEAVRIMAKVQLGKTLSPEDTSAIVSFLGSLTGKVPPNLAEAPVLPPAAFTPAPAEDVRPSK
jgi:cytochrome c peroxidase